MEFRKFGRGSEGRHRGGKEIDNAVLFPSSIFIVHLIPSQPCNNGTYLYTWVLELQNTNININGMTSVCFSLIHSVLVKRAPLLEPQYLDLNLGSIVTYHPCDLVQVISVVCVYICKMSTKGINIYKVQNNEWHY